MLIRHYRILIFILLAIIPIAIYFNSFHGDLASDSAKWGEFGSYIGGFYSALALLVIAYTTNMTKKQFLTQNEDAFFFKQYDSFQARIANYSKTSDDPAYTTNNALQVLAHKFKIELSSETILIGRRLLCDDPEKINIVSYSKIYEADKSIQQMFMSAQEFKNHMIEYMNSQPDRNIKWEYVKEFIGGVGQENKSLQEALCATGSVNFYKIPFSDRRYAYNKVVNRVLTDNAEFLDGYFSNICFLLHFASKAINQKMYIEFIKAQLTRYDVIILFYLVAGRSETDQLEHIKDLRDSGIINKLFNNSCRFLMLDLPSDKELKLEIENIFNDKA